MKKFQSTCQNCTNKFCTKLSTEVREEIFKNRIWFNLNAKEEQLFYFNNKQILIIESGSFMTIRQNNQGKQIGVDILRPGDLLGILNFNAESPQDHILILPLTDVSGCLVSKTIFDTLIQKHLSLNIIIIHHLSSRFYRIINHLTNLVFDTSKERIEYLLKLAHHNLGNFYLTHEQIALLSGLNRVTVSKTIKDVSYDFDK